MSLLAYGYLSYIMIWDIRDSGIHMDEPVFLDHHPHLQLVLVEELPDLRSSCGNPGTWTANWKPWHAMAHFVGWFTVLKSDDFPWQTDKLLNYQAMSGSTWPAPPSLSTGLFCSRPALESWEMEKLYTNHQWYRQITETHVMYCNVLKTQCHKPCPKPSFLLVV